MTLKERVGLNFPPVLLRLMLAMIFIWAGLGKVLDHMVVEGETAAKLANIGVISPPADGRGAKAANHIHTAAEFKEPVRVLRVHGLTLRIYDAAHPPAAASPAENGKPLRPYWPTSLAEGSWPSILAWTVAFTEIVGGLCLLFGLLTRFWAFSVAGVMLGAIWLTQLGPNIQVGNTVIGFLPAYDRFSPPAWQALMYQFALLMSAFALVFLGAGRASLDHVLFGPARDEDDDDDDDYED